MVEKSDAVRILHTNWRGETAERRVVPCASLDDGRTLWFGTTEWHPEPGWLFHAFDTRSETYRDFAMSGIQAWGDAAVDAALAAA